MRFISASLVYPVCAEPLRNGVVVVDEDGRIADILSSCSPQLPDSINIESYEGIICPGFVNSHCHLELSHLLGKLPVGTGLPRFIGGVVSQREAQVGIIEDAMQVANDAMWNGGIQVVGDICNTGHSIVVKQRSRIRYHSFVELLGLDSSNANLVMDRGVRLVEEFRAAGLSAFTVPHAPYSVSEALFELIAQRSEEFGSMISIHNQETESEDEMFISVRGELFQRLLRMGLPMNQFKQSENSSLRTILPWLSTIARVILVHNSYTSSKDMIWANTLSEGLWWCTCPSANLYIENRIPDVYEWLRSGARVCIGTDSLASNHQLSILEEMKLLCTRCPSISFDQILQMATVNGALALGMENETGTLEVSKVPGVILLNNVEIENPRLTTSTTVTRLA